VDPEPTICSRDDVGRSYVQPVARDIRSDAATLTAAERALIIQALREAASYTRVVARKKLYLELVAKMKECEKESVK